MIPETVKCAAADIKSLKIQGATEVAIEGVRSLKSIKGNDLKTLKEAETLLTKMRPTEPLLRNGLKYVLLRVKYGGDIKPACDEYIKTCQDAFDRIAEIGSKRIINGSKIMTHCHSRLVTGLLIRAKKAGRKNFEVFISETRPKLQGRTTAAELAKAGIPVTFYVDSAMNSFINKADMVLVGCDAITADGDFLNKIGTSQLALCADEAETEFLVATELLKFDPKTARGFHEKIEERDFREVWANPPKRVKIRNPAFDVTPAKHIHSAITEEGIIQPQNVLPAVKEKYSWIFK